MCRTCANCMNRYGLIHANTFGANMLCKVMHIYACGCANVCVCGLWCICAYEPQRHAINNDTQRSAIFNKNVFK